MRCRLLSALVLLGAISLVHADYVMIVVNLNGQEKGPPQKGGPGGGFPPQPGGGLQGGGAPPGGTGPMTGTGGPPMGMTAGGSQTGGPPGAPGAPGGIPGRPGQPAGDNADADESPDLVIVIVELRIPPTTLELRQFLTPINPSGGPGGTGRLKAKHHWGTTELIRQTPDMETIVLMTPAGKPLKSIRKQFDARHAELTKEKEKGTPPSTADTIALARWALGYGLVPEFEKVMNALAETDKTNSVVVAYLAVKADLVPSVSKDAVAKTKGKLLDGYRLAPADKHHYALLHNTDATDLKGPLNRLEQDYKRFYYWWASNGIHLPPPAAAPVAVLTNHGDNFRQLQKNLTASPVLNDSFAARREGVAVYSNSRNGDPVYTRLEMTSKQFWDMGFDRREVIKGGVAGIPKSLRVVGPNPAHLAASIRALILKALEDEWEATAMSNESARQLMFASKLLPTNVNVPEWLQFGLGSFFETPMQSPFGGPGSPSPYWLPRFKENNDPKVKRYGATALETMVGVVTDAHFRAKPQGGESPETVTRRARAAAWSLYFFLAQENNLPGLRKYFKEIGRMPRDLELDAPVLKAAFARAFGCVNADGTPNDPKLAALASRWIEFTRGQVMDAEAVHKLVRGYYDRMNKPAPPPANNGGNPGGIPGGIPGGNPNPTGRP